MSSKYVNPDGSLNMAALDTLEASLKAFTDRLTFLDQVVTDNRLGVDTVLAFQCGHSRLYLPDDYIKEWGRLYGIGLGPTPVSEVFDTDYDTPPAELSEGIKRVEQLMHPIGHCRVQVDAVLVPRAVYEAEKAILEYEDPDKEERAAVVWQRQLVNPRSQVPMIMLKWERVRGQINERRTAHATRNN